MPRRNTMALLSLMAGAAVACNDDSPDATGPSPATGIQAATTVTYSIRKLNTLGGLQSRAFAINSNGQIVGTSQNTAGRFRAFIWQSGVMKDLGGLAGVTSEANDINDAGAVVGYSTTLAGAERAVRWQNGVIKNLGTLGGRNSRATGINVNGVIVGWSETRAGTTHAFVYKNGVMTDIGTLGGTESRAWGINDVGKVVGSSTTSAGKSHAFVWTNGTFQDLGDNGTTFGTAIAINNGRIIGDFGAAPDAEGGDREAVESFIIAGGVTTVFGGLRLHASFAHDLNAGGIVVGSEEDERAIDPADAWVRQANGTLQKLPELQPGPASAQGINGAGAIVGYSTASDGEQKAVLWRAQ